jgi:hypothetical protein
VGTRPIAGRAGLARVRGCRDIGKEGRETSVRDWNLSMSRQCPDGTSSGHSVCPDRTSTGQASGHWKPQSGKGISAHLSQSPGISAHPYRGPLSSLPFASSSSTWSGTTAVNLPHQPAHLRPALSRLRTMTTSLITTPHLCGSVAGAEAHLSINGSFPLWPRPLGPLASLVACHG